LKLRLTLQNTQQIHQAFKTSSQQLTAVSRLLNTAATHAMTLSALTAAYHALDHRRGNLRLADKHGGSSTSGINGYNSNRITN
jgi:hypothetical protein